MWNPFLQITLFGFGLLSSFSGLFFDDVSSAKPFCVFISANIQKCWSGRVMKHYLMNIYAPECVLEIFINIFAGMAALLCLQDRQHEKLCNHCCLSPLHPPSLRKRTLHTSQRKSAWKSFTHRLFMLFICFVYASRLLMCRVKHEIPATGWDSHVLKRKFISEFLFLVGDWKFPFKN